MKYFTHPEGLFILKIPVEWQYKNVAVGYEEKSPFSFELYEDHIGCFQISCYSEKEKAINKSIKPQNFDSDNLEFIEQRIDGGGFNIHIWAAVVEGHMFMAKYIYDSNKAKLKKVKTELLKAEESLKTLKLLSPKEKEKALITDKYEKFMASLAASFDLLNSAYENKSAIEIIIIVANQIDAYLRLAIIMKQQLNDKNNEIDISFLYQGENDKAIFERKIYKVARDLEVIDLTLFNKLETLYSKRNKIVHRYIISDLRTRNIDDLSIEYVFVCEDIRLINEKIENEQYQKKIGIYGGARDPQEEHSAEAINFLHSQVNDKHLTGKYGRKITEFKKKE